MHQLHPLDMPAGAPLDLVAEAFWSAGSDQVFGVPCAVIDKELVVIQNDSDFRIPLFLAEVSFDTTSNRLQCVVVPPPVGAGLRDMASGAEPPARGNVAWCAISEDVDALFDIVAAFAEAGCLMDIFHKVYGSLDNAALLGDGAYAHVYKATHVAGRGKPTAVKKMNVDVDLKAIERETKMLLAARGHKNVANFRGIFRFQEEEAVRILVCFDFEPGGDLLYRILRKGEMREKDAKPVIHGVLSALAHIHAMDMLHRDVKAENILLKAPDFPILTDFGLATLTNDPEQMGRRCGSPGYIAPEVCLGQMYGPKVDVFAIGVVLYFVLSKAMPFSSPEDDTVAIMKKTVKSVLHLRRPPFDAMSSSVRSLMRTLMTKDAETRLTADAALRHLWLQPHLGTLREAESEELRGQNSPAAAAFRDPGLRMLPKPSQSRAGGSERHPQLALAPRSPMGGSVANAADLAASRKNAGFSGSSLQSGDAAPRHTTSSTLEGSAVPDSSDRSDGYDRALAPQKTQSNDSGSRRGDGSSVAENGSQRGYNKQGGEHRGHRGNDPRQHAPREPNFRENASLPIEPSLNQVVSSGGYDQVPRPRSLASSDHGSMERQQPTSERGSVG